MFLYKLPTASRHLGFTIIEILVVISLISAIAAFSFAAFNNARQKGRDFKRKEDLKALSTALLAYYTDNGQYPTCPSNPCVSGGTWLESALVPNYLKALPKDPNQAGILGTLANLFRRNIKTGTQPEPQVAGVQPPYTAETADSHIQYSRSASPPDTAGSCSRSSTATSYRVGQQLSGSTYYSIRDYLNFNTSNIGSTSTINSATLNLTVANNSTSTEFTLRVRYLNWGGTIECADWGGSPPTATLAGTFNTIDLPAVGSTFQIPLTNLTGISNTGTTYIMLSSDREENNTAPSGSEYFFAHSANATTAGYRPTLTVDWSAGGGASAPTVTTSSATSVTASGATLNGSANPNSAAATGYFRYSTTNPGTCNDTFGTRAPSSGGTSLGSGTSAVAYSQGISGLSGSTTYYFCAIANNSSGTGFGTPLSFPTSASSSAPTVTTSAATTVTSSDATLNGSANPNGAAATGWFRYSKTNPGTCNDTFGTRAPASGGTSLGSGTSAVAYSQNITDLNASTTYYFCAIASNSQGTGLGTVLSFPTSAAAPSSPYKYNYVVAADQQSYVLWAVLEKTNDPQALGGSQAICNETPPTPPPTYNYCVKSPS